MYFVFRHILAILHFNENINREERKAKDGKIYYNVTYPKYTLTENSHMISHMNEIVMWNWNNSYMKISYVKSISNMKVSHMKFSYLKSLCGIGTIHI